MSFEEELEEIDRQEWLSLFDDKQIMQITRVFLDWLYDLPDDYIPTQQIKYLNNYMNIQPEQLLRQLKVLQLQKKEIDMQITEKKMVLEKYYMDSIIMSTFSIDGVKAIRKRKPEKWEYSDTTNRFRKDMINAIEDKEQQEREEGIATKLETGFTWSIR